MVDYSQYKNIKVERKNNIGTITINRPEAMNSLDTPTRYELEHVLVDVSADDELRAVILTGAGKAFSAGGDIKGMKTRTDNPKLITSFVLGDTIKASRQLLLTLANMEKPIVAALNGDAVGLGATIALFCDIIIAAENARIGDPHVKVGLVAGDGGAVIWPLLVGPVKAKEYLLTGDLVSAKEAERIGLINRVVPTDQVYPAALEFAQRLASGAPKAISWTKLSINKLLIQQINLIIDASLGLEMCSLTSEDHREAVNAFIEKRAPKFAGR